ncbi:hypothetical protein LUX12_10025 [Streptomyces somaliensis]|uniref:hypothetical protein n=1 Tax=Streptomyces somaliensis TaxID=78355 RepID=UPI0020CC8B2F|nr:hypothetical protein [Streptomyces somaliensis]MCP9945042.1 hypothetical protein [Streptomyces somaliensis]MCP9961743.1 hypothetical protein [Streptomyces somaliensis]MCP9974558.1 hypothetical protein [Streptomyces somaliensis]
MYVSRSRGEPPGTTPPPTDVAFWCERVRYRSLAVGGADQTTRYEVGTPAEAIRRVRTEVRALASTLPPAERNRAFEWTDSGGCLHAVAALHRHEPCGFSLSAGSAWVEWSVRPFLRFHVPHHRLLPLLPSPGSPVCGETL